MRYRTSDHIEMAESHEEAVLLDTASGRYFALNEVGKSIWHELTKGACDTDQIMVTLSDSFEIDHQHRDVIETFLTQLENADLIVRTAESL